MGAAHKLRIELRAGERLFHEGDPADCAYLVEAGAIDVKRKQDARVIGTVQAGELLGETGLLDGRPRTAGAVAREPTSVRVITREHLRERLEHADPLVRHLLHLILDRYRTAMGVTGASGLAPDADLLKEDREAAMRRLRELHELEAALAQERVEIALEPVVSLADGTVAAFRAWPSVAGTPIATSAGESGLGPELGRRVLRAAAAAVAPLPGAPKLYVPVAGSHLQAESFERDLHSAIQAANLAADRCVLCVAEAQLMHVAPHARLAQLRGLGFRVGADDFGSGDSSLPALAGLPLDALVLSPSFADGLAPGSRGAEVLKVMAAMAHALRVQVVVTGVASESAAGFVRRYGFELAAGRHYSPPVTPAEAAAITARRWS
ncbi:MAG TPA: EAL domain-containing protein [Candidatus Binatia bacterium]|nr:EAL domain-containing protein [Candidatus Binatia bacterium]